ncbi:hypothetical protein SDC9_210435 [bioreactor metagenome]|uniref:Uncharacterized protein n=1 Tax=bioreactor metagenome TaxID=1076179 RepID=A0A645JHI7_9ZZZZ
MGKFFPKLSQTRVFIQTDEAGNGFNCPMLPVSALEEMNACSELMSKVDSVDALESVRKRMIALAQTVLPREFAENLNRFDIPMLSELIAYLMYGDGDDLPKEPESPKKN